MTAILKCAECKHKRGVSWNAHISCSKPDRNMTGDPVGIARGWFEYPIIFDPIWGTKECVNFERAFANDQVSDTLTMPVLNAMVDSFMRDTPNVSNAESSDSSSKDEFSGGDGNFGGGGASSDF